MIMTVDKNVSHADTRQQERTFWVLLEQTEKIDFWKMQENDHNYSSQVSRPHRSSLLPIVRTFCCYTLRLFSAIQLRAKLKRPTIVASGPLTCTDLPS